MKYLCDTNVPLMFLLSGSICRQSTTGTFPPSAGRRQRDSNDFTLPSSGNTGELFPTLCTVIFRKKRCNVAFTCIFVRYVKGNLILCVHILIVQFNVDFTEIII